MIRTCPNLNKTVADELLTPTRIYVKNMMALLGEFGVKGLAHITGGGITENLPRVFPQGCRARVRKGSWEILPVFKFIQEKGRIDEAEMLRDFNMGIGLIAVLGAEEADSFARKAEALGEKAYIIGDIVSGEKGVEYVD